MAVSRWIAVVFAVLAAASCEVGGEQIEPPARTAAVPTGITSVTSTEADVERAVRDYLRALAEDDAAGKIANSTGDLVSAARWEREVSLSLGSQIGVLHVSNLRVTSVRRHRASATVEARIVATNFVQAAPLRIRGPVTLVREDGAWKVTDYRQDGRSRRASIFTRIAGRGDAAGVTVRVVGADLRTDTTLLVLRATNRTRDSFRVAPGTIVTASGARIPGGEPSATQRSVVPTTPLETFMYWGGRSLELDTRRLTVVVPLIALESGVRTEVEVPIRLIA